MSKRSAGPSRTPPRAVLKTLRREVGFCCPVIDCGNPYLTWHHFDPPWRTEHHHRPEGMIALCREHADKADNGAFTDDQLRELKRTGIARALEIRGRFDWMRRDLIAVVGGNFFLRPATILQIGKVRCIWFERDEDGFLLLNVRLPSLSSRPRARIESNVWVVKPDVEEVVCPPHGRLIDIRYDNGDRFRVEFFVAEDSSAFASRYPAGAAWAERLEFPVTIVELSETAAGTRVKFDPRRTTIGGMTSVNGLFDVEADRVIYFVLASDEDLRELFPDDPASDDDKSNNAARTSRQDDSPTEVRSVFSIDLSAPQPSDFFGLNPDDWSPEALEDLVLRAERLKELGPVDDDVAVMYGSTIFQATAAAHREALEHDTDYQRLRERRDRGANARFHALYREQIAALAAVVRSIPVEAEDVPEIVADLERVVRSYAATAKPPM